MMRYEHVFTKMPQALREVITGQEWCRSMLQQGVKIHTLLTEKGYLEKLFQRMSMAERHTIHLIIAAFGCEPFTKDALENQAAVRMAGAEVAVGLTGLRKYGVIATFRKAWGEQLFVLPEDSFGAWQSLLYPDICIRTLGEDTDLELRESEMANPRGLVQQLFHFLAACFQQPALPLTNKGTLHKKQLQKLSEHLVLPRDTLQATGLSYAFRDIYDVGIAVLLEMAIRLKILVNIGDRFVCRQTALFDWLAHSYGEQQSQLYNIWRQLHLPVSAWLYHGISLMDRVSSGEWYCLDDVVIWIKRCSIDKNLKDESSIHKALMQQWIEPLCVFRWLEHAVDPQGNSWFRWMISVDSTMTMKAGTHQAGVSS